MKLQVSWRAIPDGSTAIVEFTISGELTVDAANLQDNLRLAMTNLVARVSGQRREDVEAQFIEGEKADLWLGGGPRPEEPDA